MVEQAQVEFVRVDASKVHPNDWNPNEMAEETFNELAEDIGTEDLDQPIVVVPHPEKAGEFMIVDGEHRWRAARAGGLEQVPVVVRHYDVVEQMAATMRRNMLRGNTDPVKFTKLVNRMREHANVPISVIRQKMAVTEKDFGKLYRQATAEDKDAAANAMKASEKTLQVATMVANLSTTVRDLILEYGETIKHGFVYFMFKGKKHLCVSMDNDLRKAVEQLIAIQKDEKAPPELVTQKLTEAIKKVCQEWQ